MEKSYDEIYSRNRIEWLWRIARSDVSPAAVKVGLLFATFYISERREEVSPSFAWICKEARLSRPTVGRCVEELVTAGYLEVIKYPGHKFCYALPFDGKIEWSGPILKNEGV